MGRDRGCEACPEWFDGKTFGRANTSQLGSRLRGPTSQFTSRNSESTSEDLCVHPHVAACMVLHSLEVRCEGWRRAVW